MLLDSIGNLSNHVIFLPLFSFSFFLFCFSLAGFHQRRNGIFCVCGAFYFQTNQYLKSNSFFESHRQISGSLVCLEFVSVYTTKTAFLLQEHISHCHFQVMAQFSLTKQYYEKLPLKKLNSVYMGGV